MDSFRPENWCFVGFFPSVLFFPLNEDIHTKQVLDFTQVDRENSNKDNKKFSCMKAWDKKGAVTFEQSCETNHYMSTLEIDHAK